MQRRRQAPRASSNQQKKDGLGMRPCGQTNGQTSGNDWEGIGHVQEEWACQDVGEHGGNRRILEGRPLVTGQRSFVSITKENPCVEKTVQCQQRGNVQQGFSIVKFLLLRKTLEQAVQPLTRITDNLGVAHGLGRRGGQTASWDKHPHADE